MEDRKFCIECGTQMPATTEFCPKCGIVQPIPEKLPPDISPTKFCLTCGNKMQRLEKVCHKCKTEQPMPFLKPKKNKTTTGILAILLGGFGAHRFYLNKPFIGMLYLLFFLLAFWTTIPTLIGVIEGIIFLTMHEQEFDSKYN